jgi:hypothetical protein
MRHLARVGCIDRQQFARSSSRTLPSILGRFLGSVQLRLQVASLPGSQNLLDPPLYKLSSLVPIHAAAQ